MIQQLRQELTLFRNKFFGRSSERHVEDDSQLHLFHIGEDQADGESEEEQGDKPKKGRNRKKKSEKIPEHLERKVIEADVSSEDRTCSCCGDEMPIIGTDITERVDLVPAKLFVWEIRRHKRACGKCKESVAQVPAGEEPGGLTTPVPGSDYGFSVYTQIIVAKFADHLPLYRGEDIFARAGMFIPRNTQFGMMAKLTKRIQLTREHRDLILKYGDVSGRLEASLRRWPIGQAIRRVGLTGSELHLLIGDLSYSCNHDKTGKDLDAVLDLCEHLEYAQRTGDGDLDILW